MSSFGALQRVFEQFIFKNDELVGKFGACCSSLSNVGASPNEHDGQHGGADPGKDDVDFDAWPRFVLGADGDVEHLKQGKIPGFIHLAQLGVLPQDGHNVFPMLHIPLALTVLHQGIGCL